MTTTRIFSSSFPSAIDTDDQLPYIVNGVSDIEAFSINALKDSIIAIERTLGIDPGGEFPTLSKRLNRIDSTYVSITGDVVNGDLILSNTSIPRLFFGDSKNAAVIWPGVDNADSALPNSIYENAAITSSEVFTSVPMSIIGVAADGESNADEDIPTLTSSKADIFGNDYGETTEPSKHRRIRMFNDIYVTGYWHNNWGLVANNLVINKSFDSVLDLADEYRNESLLSSGGSLIVGGNLTVNGNFDGINEDSLIAWAGTNKPVHDETSSTNFQVKLRTADRVAENANDLHRPYPRVDVIKEAYPIGFGPVVTIPANANLKGLLIIFSGVLIGPGRVLLKVNSGNTLSDPDDLSGRIDWPRLENLSLYDYDAKSPEDGVTPIIVNDIYALCGQVVIPSGIETKGTLWINDGDNSHPSTQPFVGTDHEATIDFSQTNTLSMYYDYGWVDYTGRRWKYNNPNNGNTENRVLYPYQQAQMFVYGLTKDLYEFKTRRISTIFEWDLLEELFNYSSLDDLRQYWSVTDSVPESEISIGSVNFYNYSQSSDALIYRKISNVGDTATLAFKINTRILPLTQEDGLFEISIGAENSEYSIYIASDGIYMKDHSRGYVLIPNSAEYVSSSGKFDEWNVWFSYIGNRTVSINRIYKNNTLIYSEVDELSYFIPDNDNRNYKNGDVYLAARSVNSDGVLTDVEIGYIKLSSNLSGYGESYDYDGYGPYGYGG